MKYFFALPFLLYTMGASAQRIIEKPKFSAANTTTLRVDKIELSDTATVIHFQSFFTPGNWIMIARDTYINAGNEKLMVKSAAGLVLDKRYIMPPSGQSSFKLVFPPVSSAVKKIDFIESDCENCFKIYDIALEKQKNLVSEDLTGNWYYTEGGNDYAFGIYDSVIVWNNNVWKYTDVRTKGKITELDISNGKEKRTIYAKAYGKQYKIGTDAQNLLLVSKTENEHNQSPDTRGFILPVLKADSSTYKGYLKGYSTRLGYKTGTISANNIITGSQEKYLITINPDGTFHARFPMYHPHQAFVRIPGYSASVYLEPGNELFHVIDLGDREKRSSFQGTLARVNSELLRLTDLQRYTNFEELNKSILDVSHLQYKDQVITDRDSKLSQLKAYSAKYNLERKTYQVLEKEIIFGAAQLLLRYNMNRESAYRRKHKTPNNQRQAAVEAVKLDSAFYGFAELPVSDELAITSLNFGYFINGVRFLNDVMAFGNAGHSFKGIIAQLKTRNQLDPEDVALADQLSNPQTGTEADKDKLDVLNANSKLFIAKYQDKINNIASGIFHERQRMKIKSMLNLDDDALLLDIITAQTASEKLKRAFVPYTDQELNEIQDRVHMPFLKAAFIPLNNELKAKVEANKLKKGFVLNQVPRTAPDSLFAGIIKKYVGKAVYVDFWATWCAPCRSGIEQIAPLKEELQNENVVFLYITDTSSPLQTYNNMIPGIKGEHFRVTRDEWNLLSSRFKISGIPHYALVDKRGIVVNDHLPHLSNTEIRKHLMGLAKE